MTQRPTEAFREGQIEVEGFSIRYLEAGEGDPVVVLDSMTWDQSTLHDTLAQKYRVVVLELPGVSQSPASPDWQSASDLAGIVARAVANVISDRYTLIGTSFSANVALWQTLREPDDVEALVLISPTAILPESVPTAGTPDEIARRLLAHPENAQAPLSEAPGIVGREQALVQRLSDTVHDEDAERRLGEIQCPTLLVFGSKDNVVNSGAARIYSENIPNCNISIVYDAGHAVILERPDALISLVADYVERRDTFVVNSQSTLINP